MSITIELSTEGEALIIRFVRPEIRSPLSLVVLDELEELVARCAADTSKERLIFTGTDNVFASGADLREIAAVTAADARDFAKRGQQLMSSISDLAKTTIAAINGYCFGGALDLALACDRRIASPTAQFAHPGAGLGIITGWGGTQRLPRLVGEANALEMFFTAAPINAERAFSIGMIDEIADDVVRAASEFVRAD